MNYFIFGDFTHYANTIEDSSGTEVAGIFSRHGQSTKVYNKEPLNLKELDLNLRNLITAWLSVKIKKQLGVSHNEKYQNRNIVEPMKDEDFYYDL